MVMAVCTSYLPAAVQPERVPQKTISESGNSAPREERVRVSTTEIQAARVAMLSLYATSDTTTEIDLTRARIGTESEMPWEDAIVALAALPKPTQCTAVVENRVLHVNCHGLSEEWRDVHRYRLEDALELPAMLRAISGSSDDGPILLLAGQLSVVISTEAVAAWLRSYIVTGPLSFSTRAAEVHERRNGAQVVIEFSTAERLDLDTDIGQRFREILRRRPIK
jgi:hypothetical protein